MAQAILQIKWMRIYPLRNSKPRIDLNGTLGKNLLGNGLVRLVYKFVKSVTKTNNKMRELKTYDEAINNPIHGNRWCKGIDKKL